MSRLRGVRAPAFVIGDGQAPPIFDGGIVLDGAGTILALGPFETVRKAHSGIHFESVDAVVLPGLVNAHTHLELSALRGQVSGGRGFAGWAEAMLSARDRLGPERDVEAIDAGVGELLRAGTVAVGEVTNTLAAVPALATAPLVGRVFHEVFGLTRQSGQAMLAEARAVRARMDVSSAVAGWPGNLSYSLSPHTLFTSYPELVRELLSEGRSRGARMSLHLCEHAAERAMLADGSGPLGRFFAARGATDLDFSPPGLGPVAYARALGALASDVIAVHLTDARPDELSEVAAVGAPVVLCPRSNLHIEVRLPPLTDLLAAGLRPGLGTDSLASVPTLDVLAEAQALRQRFPAVPPRTLIAMCTGWGAQALGFGELGTLRVGRAPGIVTVACGGASPSDPEAFVLDTRSAERELIVPAVVKEPLSP